MEQPRWHTISAGEALAAVHSGLNGLSKAEALHRLETNGPNKLAEGRRKTLWSVFLAQFADLMIWVLIAAAVISVFLGERVDAAIIAVVIILNAILGTIQESRAEAALEALKKMASPTARVLRDGAVTNIPAAGLVVGDLVLLEAGDSIPADLRLLESASLKVDESALTGESVPVEKINLVLDDPDAALGDRVNMAYLGTSVTYGRGRGVVVATGMNTQMGAIAGQLSAGKEITPLQKKLNHISNLLSVGVVGIAAIIFVIGLLSDREPLEIFLTAVSLAVAAIPEGLVAVVTIVLAMGMSRLAKSGAIIRRLPAVETLGSTQVICSDKTGTLTQNRMTVQQLWGEDPVLLTEAMGHCNDSRLDENDKPFGDPTETALITYILEQGRWSAADIRARVRLGEIPFDSERKLSTVAVRHPSGDGLRIFVKGAPDLLLQRCINEHRSDGTRSWSTPLDDLRTRTIEDANKDMARQALRILAFAYKDTASADFGDPAAVESNLTFLGMAGMKDPARPEAREAIAVCRRAGIVPVMITGDHRETAVAIAKDLGILSDGRQAITGAELEAIPDDDLVEQVSRIGVYARVAPEHKSRIVAAWQKQGRVVAMTGDGVNDAPALKAADIGVGMGITGTDVSKGASDMVLTDDNFATIVTAVREGRRIFDNIHKTVRFLLSSNAGEVLAILTATLAGWQLLAPVQILWINLVTDTFPALALGVEPAEREAMERAPRHSKAPFLSKGDWLRLILVGIAEAALTITAYLLGGKGATGTTMAFLTISLSQLFASLGFQSERHSILQIKPKEHPMLWLAFLGSSLLQLVVMLPPLRHLFRLAPLSPLQWLTVVLLCLLMLGFIELQKLPTRWKKKADRRPGTWDNVLSSVDLCYNMGQGSHLNRGDGGTILPKLGWVCSYTPEEIPATLGLDSCRLYGDGGGSSREVAWKYLPANFCPLSRACLEDVLGEQEPLAGVILASSCHAMVHLANALEYTSQCRKLKVYRLDLPRTPGGNNPEAVEALATSLRQLAGELSRDYGVTWDQDTFWQVIEEHQQVRLKLQELDRLRRAHPEVFRAAGLMEVIRTVTRSPKGKSAQLLDNLLGVLRDGQPAGDPEVTRLVTGLRRQGDPRGPRLLVTGSPLAPACLDLIEEVGGNIVGDDLCHGYRYTLPQVEKSGDPWLQLARGYLGRLPCPRMLAVRKRATELLARVREGDAQGIVYHALKFCDPSLYEFPLFKDFIAKAGVPLLYLETEYREGGLEQVRTRLQAFLELLGKEGRG